MKTSVLIVLSMLSLNAFSQAETKGGGGGDASEERVNEIRSDILNWIEKGGAEGLKLPKGITLSDYESEMKRILKPKGVIVGFIEKDHETDEELQVSVGGVPKTCRGFYSRKNSRPHILCNISRFENTRESDQYRLIHHEYAGLVSLEQNEGASSDYEISSQLTDYLVKTTVLRLAIKMPKTETFSLNIVHNKNFESTGNHCGLHAEVSDNILTLTEILPPKRGMDYEYAQTMCSRHEYKICDGLTYVLKCDKEGKCSFRQDGDYLEVLILKDGNMVNLSKNIKLMNAGSGKFWWCK